MSSLLDSQPAAAAVHKLPNSTRPTISQLPSVSAPPTEQSENLRLRRELKGEVQYARRGGGNLHGCVKLKSDPQVRRFTSDRVLRQFSVVSADWVFALVLFVGKDVQGKSAVGSNPSSSYFSQRISRACLWTSLLVLPITVSRVIEKYSSNGGCDQEWGLTVERIFALNFSLISLLPLVIYLFKDAIVLAELLSKRRGRQLSRPHNNCGCAGSGEIADLTVVSHVIFGRTSILSLPKTSKIHRMFCHGVLYDFIHDEAAAISGSDLHQLRCCDNDKH